MPQNPSIYFSCPCCGKVYKRDGSEEADFNRDHPAPDGIREVGIEDMMYLADQEYDCPICGPITADETIGTFGEHCFLCESPVTTNQKGQNTMNEKPAPALGGFGHPRSGGNYGTEAPWRTIGLYGPFVTNAPRLILSPEADNSPDPVCAGEDDPIFARLPEPLKNPFMRESLMRARRATDYAVHAKDPSPLQADILHELGQMGMSWADAKEAGMAPKRTLPLDEYVWCEGCGSVYDPKSDKWDMSGLPLRAQRSARSCSHEMRVGCQVDQLEPTSTTPYLMSTGAWKRRVRAEQVHSPLSHGRIKKGKMSVFDWHRTFVTGSAERRDRVKMSGKTDTESLVAVSPGGAIRTTKGVSVLTAVDGHLSGDSTIPYRSAPVGHVSETLHNGKVAKTEAEKAAQVEKARNVRLANLAKKKANAENAAAGASKRTKGATEAILADLAELASKVTK